MSNRINPPQSTTEIFTLEFLDADSSQSEKLRAARVRVELLEKDNKPSAILFQGRSDAAGKVAFRLPKNAGAKSARIEARVTVLDLDGARLLEKQITLEEGKAVKPVQVPTKTQREKLDDPLGDASKFLGHKLSNELRRGLQGFDVNSLATLRKADELLSKLELSKDDRSDLDQLRAHAWLQLISRDLKTNSALIRKKYLDAFSIAATSKETFIKSVTPEIAAKEAEIIHLSAARVVALIRQQYADGRVAQADGRTPGSTAATCSCGCKHALSPLAYLADLMDYAVRHVKEVNKAFDMRRLSTLFFQPFGDLPKSCSASETLLHQNRICIEVLRRKAGPGNGASNQISDHVARTYRTLLLQLGTSYDELRLTRTALNAQKENLAARLGIDVLRLADLFLDPLDEANLAKVFGFASTDPNAAAIDDNSVLFSSRSELLQRQWQAEDQLRELPILDPEYISPKWIRPNATVTLLETFATELQGTYDALKSRVNNVNELQTVLGGDWQDQNVNFHGLGLKATTNSLNQLWKLRQEGESYPPWAFRDQKDQPVSISSGEMDLILAVRELMKTPGQVNTNDKKALWRVLTGIAKRNHHYPSWRLRERATKLTISPDVIYSPEAIAQYPPPDLLEAPINDLTFLTEWLNIAKAREQQVAGLREQLTSLVERVEEACLPKLRDELIQLLKVTPDQVTNELLINGSASGCHKTTRVAQAIETLQLLLWGIQRGQIENQNLSIDAPNFEEEWKWLGSYATWRSAMFVFLYPENVLLPSLYQSESLVFNVARKIISGEIVEQPPLQPEGSQPARDGSDEEQQIAQSIFLQLGVLSPTNPEDIRKLLFFMLPNRQLDGTATEIPADSNLNPYYRSGEAYENPWADPSTHYPNVALYVKGPQDVLVCPGRLTGELAEVIWNWGNTDYEIEDTYLLPLHAAITLHRGPQKNFEAALDFYRWVYDFERNDFRFARVKELLEQRHGGVQRNDDWLLDPLNPHAIAGARTGVDIRFTLLSIIQCHLDYADSEFAKDTSESLAKARELYLTARRLLTSEALGKPGESCEQRLRRLIIEIGDTQYLQVVFGALDHLVVRGLELEEALWGDLLKDLKQVLVLQQGGPPRPELAIRNEVRNVFKKYLTASQPTLTMGDAIRASANEQQLEMNRLLADPKVFDEIQLSSNPAGTMKRAIANTIVANPPPDIFVIRAPSFSFCIPPNPGLATLRLRAELGLFKLNHCMNSAGMVRPVEPYSAPTDERSGAPAILPDGRISVTSSRPLPPTQYRYKTLIERAKQLVGIAQQLEASYLSFMERRDEQGYNMMIARQQLGLTRATVALQKLRVTEAEHGQTLADRQWDRANESFAYYKKLIDDEWLDGETWAVGLMAANTAIQLSVAALTAGVAIAAGLVAGGVMTSGSGPGMLVGALSAGSGAAALAMSQSQIAYSSVTGGLSSWSSALAMTASFERREQEWKFQKALADIDKEIAAAQQTLADDRYNIAVQEQSISEMQSENARDVVNFLNTKFTNVELYAWMSGVVGNAYQYFLQEATSIGKLAQNQLAFERAQPLLGFVLDDYWTATNSQSLMPGDDSSSDRRGLTGSARLLQDLYKLDQHAFTTDQRKLQISRTFSLALLDPIVFVHFRETGQLPFTTTLAMFDHDFPGHYLRLIKRVRVSVVALIPPVDGIKASLTLLGSSQAVTADSSGAEFTEVRINRPQESIALSSPTNTTGLFELIEQPEMLLPFEGSGVAASWIFEMRKAANAFDFSTISDVLVTIEYTALDSDVYRGSVLQRMPSQITAERSFSLRRQFPDQWFDLHNPRSDNRSVTIDIKQSDFPPNIGNDLFIKQVSIVLARAEEVTLEAKIQKVQLTPKAPRGGIAIASGGPATTFGGIVSTRSSGEALKSLASPNLSPVGQWELSFGAIEAAAELFDGNKANLEDILLVISWQAGSLAGTAA